MKEEWSHPPKWPDRILKWFCSEEHLEILQGDLQELYEYRLATKGRRKARLYYIKDSFDMLRPFARKRKKKDYKINSLNMFGNYYKVAFRNISKNVINNTISILGLGIGIACCLTVFLYIQDEFSFDSFHKNETKLFRVIKPYYGEDGATVGVNTIVDPALASALKDQFPEVKRQTQLLDFSLFVKYGDQAFLEPITMASHSFFEMFSFSLLDGKPESVLLNMQDLVITEAMAKKYFGNENPIGKTLRFDAGGITKEFIISGLAEDPPTNSSIQFQFLINVNNYPSLSNNLSVFQDKGYDNLETYIELSDETAQRSINEKFKQFTQLHYASILSDWDWKGDENTNPFGLALQPISDLHFNEAASVNRNFVNKKRLMFILGGIAFVILLISIFNHINLSIGMASKRSKEIGVRKVIGANKLQLIFQFWSEATLLAIFGFILGVGMASLLMPIFNEFTDKHLEISELFTPLNALIIVIYVFSIGMMAGLYPGLFMSRLRPVTILKGVLKVKSGKGLTKALMLIQFSVSILLITLASIVSRQLTHLIEKDLGYNNQGLITVPFPRGNQEKAEIFRNKLVQYKNVDAVTASNFRLGLREAGSIGGDFSIHFGSVDQVFFKTIGVEVVQGRDFRSDTKEDANSVIVDERFMTTFGLTSIEGVDIGRIFEELDGRKAPEFLYGTKIIGVVKTFQYLPVTHELRNSVFFSKPLGNLRNVLIKVSTDDYAEVIGHIENVWEELIPEIPFSYQFQDEMIEGLYMYERRFGKIMGYTSSLTFLITGLGLFGLSLIMISNRTKEIAMRKILGARLIQVIYMNIKEIIFIVLIANVVAIPFSFHFGQGFLEGYPSRVDFGVSPALFAAILSIAIAVLTSLYNVYKVANTNPIQYLRNE